MNTVYDLIVIGGGNAGMAAAGAAHAQGKNVAIIEHQEFGGTCPNRGCTPKKVLVAAADAMDTINRADAHGISLGDARLDWMSLINRTQHMISSIPDAMESAARNRATVYKGIGSFQSPNTIRVENALLQAEHIVVATGSTPRTLSFNGADLLMTSDDLFNLKELPRKIVFIGGGVIALEFSHVFARAGVEVIVLEALPNLLPRMDKDAVEQLKLASEAIGIRFETNVTITGVAKNNGHIDVVYEQDQRPVQICASLVVNGTGRVPNIDKLNLEAGGVEVEGGAILVDSAFRSRSNPGVYVVGDALSETPQLSPLATLEGATIGNRIFAGHESAQTKNVIPQVVHSIPSLASVGLTEEQATKQFPNLSVHVSDMSGWFSAKTFAESFAWAKILIDQDSDKIVGAHMLGHRGEEIINIFTLAMNHSVKATDLKSTTFAFPTFASDIKNLW